MKNRTYIAKIVKGMNLSVFGFVVSHSDPKKTVGSDYQMVLNITDESTEQKLSVQLFLEDEKSFPKCIIEKGTIVKIENLNMKEKNGRISYLIDRKKGCYFFEVKREKVSYTPYFECSKIAYKEGPVDKESILSIQSHFFNEIPVGPKMLSAVVKVDSVFTAYGYIKEVLKSSAMTTLVMSDPSTDKELRVRIWKREKEYFPERHACICIFNLKVKKIDQVSVTADISSKVPLTWTENIPKDVQLLFDAHRMINSRWFINTFVDKINILNDDLETPEQAIHNRIEANRAETEEYALKQSIKKEAGLSDKIDLSSVMPDIDAHHNLSSVIPDTDAHHNLSSVIPDIDAHHNLSSVIPDGTKVDQVIAEKKSPSKRLSPEADTVRKPPIKKLSIGSYVDKNDLPESYTEADIVKEDKTLEKDTKIFPCQKNQSLSNLSIWKRQCFSFKESDLIYDELIQLPIKPYHTNSASKAVTFDKVALLILDKIEHKTEKDNILVQHVAFFKNIPIIFHMCKKPSSVRSDIAGYIFVLKNSSAPEPADSMTLHVLLYTNLE